MKLKFQFDSFHDLLWMNGHGPYVWACYAAVFLGLFYLALAPRLRRRRFVRQQRILAQRLAARTTESSVIE